MLGGRTEKHVFFYGFITDRGIQNLEKGADEVEFAIAMGKDEKDIKFFTQLIVANRFGTIYLTKNNCTSEGFNLNGEEVLALGFHPSVCSRAKTGKIKTVSLIAYKDVLTQTIAVKSSLAVAGALLAIQTMPDQTYRINFENAPSKMEALMRQNSLPPQATLKTPAPPLSQPITAKIQQNTAPTPVPKGTKEARKEGPNSVVSRTDEAGKSASLVSNQAVSNGHVKPVLNKPTLSVPPAPFPAVHSPAGERASSFAIGSGRGSNESAALTVAKPMLSSGASRTVAPAALVQKGAVGEGPLQSKEMPYTAPLQLLASLKVVGQKGYLNDDQSKKAPNVATPPNRLPPPLAAPKNVAAPQAAVGKGPVQGSDLEFDKKIARIDGFIKQYQKLATERLLTTQEQDTLDFHLKNRSNMLDIQAKKIKLQEKRGAQPT